MSGASLVRVAVQTALLPLLARLLSPHDYGLVSLAMPVVVFAMIVSDGGLSAPLLRRAEFDPAVWSSAHWLVVAAGGLLAAALLLIAPVMAHVYRQPDLQPVVSVLALTLVAQAACTVPSARMQRLHRFQGLALIEIVATLCGAAALLALALRGAGAWSLVGQQLGYWLVRVGLILAFTPWRPDPVCRPSLIMGDVAFGWSILRVNMIGFVTRSLDVYMLGLFRDSTAVGLYAVAMQVARLPANVILGPLHGVLLSHLVKIKDSPARVGDALAAVTAAVSAIVVPPTAVAAVAAPEIFAFVLSPRWHDAAALYAALVPAAALQSITFLVMPCLVALGRPDRQLHLTAGFTVLWATLALAGATQGGLGIALGIVLAYALFAPFLLWHVRDVIAYRARAYLTGIGHSALAGAVAAAACLALRPLVPGGAFVLVAALCAACGAGLALAFNRRPIGKAAHALHPA